jgi:hypothetical protein
VSRQIDAWQPAVVIFTAIQRDGTAGAPAPRLKELVTVVTCLSSSLVASDISIICRAECHSPPQGGMGDHRQALYEGTVTFKRCRHTKRNLC